MSDSTTLTLKILASLQSDPGRTALIGEGESWSRRDLIEASTGWARRCTTSGVGPGDRVLLAGDPSLVSAAALLGVLRAGAVAVPLSPRAHLREIEYATSLCEPRLVLADAPVCAAIATLASSPRVIPLDGTESLARTAAAPRSCEGELEERTTSASSSALILFTSGTTGRPKGVVHTHGSLAAGLASLQRAWRWSKDDRLLLALPWFHMHGLVVGLLGAWWSGMSVRVCAAFDAVRVLDLLGTEQCTLFYGVPTMYARLLEMEKSPGRKWPRLRLWVCGSAPLTRTLQHRFEAASCQRILQRYGTTETGMVLAQRDGEPATIGRVGRPLDGWEVRVVDPDTGADSAEGELRVKGPALYTGYWNDPASDAEARVESFHRTGDRVRRHPDGSYDIVGRLRLDFLKVHGHKVSIVEIESVLAEHPYVLECAVVGVPDVDRGEAAVAFVRTTQVDARAFEADLLTWSKQRLAPFQVPRAIHCIEDLPRIGPSKVDKTKLTAIARSSGTRDADS